MLYILYHIYSFINSTFLGREPGLWVRQQPTRSDGVLTCKKVFVLQIDMININVILVIVNTINISIIISVPGKSQIAALPFRPLQFLANRHTTPATGTPTPPTPWAGTTIQGEIEAAC